MTAAAHLAEYEAAGPAAIRAHLTASCRPCNAAKANRPLLEFLLRGAA